MAVCPRCQAQVLWTPCQRCGQPWQPARIEATDIPGLFDVFLSDGRVLTDLPTSVVDGLVRELGLVAA
jgi:hypothetical protein